MDYLIAYRNRIGVSIGQLYVVIQKKLKGIPRNITYRIKQNSEIELKMKYHKTNNIFDLRDIYGFRIIVNEQN